MPLARARLSPNRLTFYANILLVLNLFLMAFVNWPRAFLLLAAFGGAGWTLSATELWIAAQRAMPDWARGRLNATIVMCSQAATALGGVIWGSAAATAGVVPTFLGAGVLAIRDDGSRPLCGAKATLHRLRRRPQFGISCRHDFLPRFGPDAIVAGGGESGLDRHRICN